MLSLYLRYFDLCHQLKISNLAYRLYFELFCRKSYISFATIENRMNLCAYPALVMYPNTSFHQELKPKTACFLDNFLDTINEKPSVYAALKLLVLLYLIHRFYELFLLLSYIHFSLNYKLCCYYLYFEEIYTARIYFIRWL